MSLWKAYLEDIIFSFSKHKELAEKAFRQVKDQGFSWFSGGLAISSNPQTRAVGKEYDALIALGPAIIEERADGGGGADHRFDDLRDVDYRPGGDELVNRPSR